MKLPCPYCTENITYDHNLAGKTIKCSYCQRNVLMTPLDKLPPDYRQEYLAEQEKIRKKQEAEQRKLDEKRRRELDREDAERKRQIETQMRLVQQREKELETQVEKSYVGDKPRDSTSSKTAYRRLHLFSNIIFFLGAIELAIGAILLIIAIPPLVGGVLGESIAALSGITLGLSLLFSSLFALVTAEIIQLLINVAKDVNNSKNLLKRIAYPSRSSSSSSWGEQPTPPPIADDAREDAAVDYLEQLEEANASTGTEYGREEILNQVVPPPFPQARKS